MKEYINFLKMAFALLLIVSGYSVVQAQDTTSVKTAISNRQFVFKAHTALPTSGSLLQLNGQHYEVRLSGDSLVTHLPYFGRAYSASIGTEGGIKFTSIEFDYIVTNRRKGGWDVVIRPKDVRDVRELALTVSELGNASLRAMSNNRQPISFNGNIKIGK